MRILLKGYYGFGNLGDDILLLCTCGICRTVFPGCHITVMSAGNTSNYILPLTKGVVSRVVPLGTEPPADLVLQGGGGVYYDFQKGSWSHYLLNSMINLVGLKRWHRLLTAYRSAKGFNYNHKALRMGLGIGVGTFSGSSSKFYQKMSELASCHWLFPRDRFSYDYLIRRSLPAKIMESSDLAFLTRFWLPSLEISSKPRHIAFVLKNWANHCGYLQVIKETMTQLKLEGFTISVFIFESSHDRPIRSVFKEFNLQIWDPDKGELATYLSALASQSLVVTSRAHGAIIAAALSIPSICLGIEPKLKNISQMFPLSGNYLELPLNVTRLKNTITTARSVPRSLVDQDFQENQKVMEKSLKIIKTAFKEHALVKESDK